jgi:glyoxylase-like metal-dependent hydrolase (beta-lactamase superfamily II)
MKKNTFLSILAALLVTACSGSQQPSESQSDALPDNVYCVKKYQIYGIQDHDQTMSAELFKGYNDSLLTQVMPTGETEAGINVFLVDFGEFGYILFDAGIGADKGGRLMETLDSLDISPNEISQIFITHLHFDHVGGLFNPDGTAAFPSANLYIPQPEYDAWSSGKMGDTKVVEMIDRCYEGRINCFTPGDTIDSVLCLVTIPAYGHTPGHTIYNIEDVLIVGDIMHAVALQLDHPEFCARFDADPAQAVATRKAVLDRARTEHLTLCGMHFPRPLTIKF